MLLKDQMGKLTALEGLNGHESIAHVKNKYSDSSGIPASQQAWRYRVHILEDDHALVDYHIADGATLEWARFVHLETLNHFTEWLLVAYDEEEDEEEDEAEGLVLIFQGGLLHTAHLPISFPVFL